MTRDDVIRMAREAGIEVHPRKNEARIGFDALLGIDSTGKLERFAALVAAAERECMAAKLIRIGDGYGVRDVGLDEATYTRMQQTAYEHANVILTNGCNHSSPSLETVRILRARGEQ